jgi:Holliday junction resolvase RusA-like endonuclease
VYSASYYSFSEHFLTIFTVGSTHQHPHNNTQVTKRNAGVKVKISEQENAVRYVFVTDKMIFLCEAATLAVKLKYFIIPFIQPHKRHNKIPPFYTEAVGYPHIELYRVIKNSLCN